MFQQLHGLLDEELDRIERLMEASSPGPWISCVLGREPEAESNYIELGSCNELGTCDSIELIGGTVADQEFIACAQQYLPRLLLEIRASRARMKHSSTALGDPLFDSAKGSFHANSAAR
jgi:hypothetical protein